MTNEKKNEGLFNVETQRMSSHLIPVILVARRVVLSGFRPDSRAELFRSTIIWFSSACIPFLFKERSVFFGSTPFFPPPHNYWSTNNNCVIFVFLVRRALPGRWHFDCHSISLVSATHRRFCARTIKHLSRVSNRLTVGG